MAVARRLAILLVTTALAGCSDSQPPPGGKGDRGPADAVAADLTAGVDRTIADRDARTDAPTPDAIGPDGPTPDGKINPQCKSWGDWTCTAAGQGCSASCPPGPNSTFMFCNTGSCTCTDPGKPSPVQCAPVTPDLDGCKQCSLAFSQGCCNP